MPNKELPASVVEELPTLDELVAAVRQPEQVTDIADQIYSHYEKGETKEDHGPAEDDLGALLEHYGVDVSETSLTSLFQVMDEQGTGKAQLEPFCKYFQILVRVVQHRKKKQEENMMAMAGMASRAVTSSKRSPGKRPSHVPGFLRGTAASSSKALPEIERRDSTTISMRRRSSTSTLADGPRLSISGLNVKPKDVAYLQRVFNELDSDEDGLVCWEGIRKKVPSLPKEPFKATGLERESQISMPQLLRLLYPELTEQDASIHASRTASSSELVLPEDMKSVIGELFEVLDADGDGLLEPKDIIWHSEKMGQSTDEVAQSYIKMFLDTDRSKIGRAEFEQWYIDDMLSDKFKEANLRKKSAALIK
jgi:Ca2+-binding EF-hand superfamily protein